MTRLGAPGVWGIVGVLLLLAQAIYRLAPLAFELVDRELDAIELTILVGWCVFNGYAEGHRGFHKAFSPRVVARAVHLSTHPRPVYVAIAPLYVMGLVYATRKRLIVSWVLTLGIVAIVAFVRQLAQPWRGIIDAGVVIGLAWGVLSICYFVGRALAGRAMPVPPDVPTQ